ncbi:integumentary mucin C.1-like [Physella acuta]|uniref:integumentary mucin C.1-like n=1 Tax=Physella acuta TaxID=109671 RepID=UPI0027DC5FFA|nr:integumentary mucin C.1-like [Physella acuta]
MLAKVILFLCWAAFASALQCPVCTEKGNPASCTEVVDCHQDHDVCEFTLHLRDENRLEFTCRNRPACNHQELQDCDVNQHERCWFCCASLQACREQAHLVFNTLLTTPVPTTATPTTPTTPSTTTTPTTTTSPTTTTTTTPAPPNMCIQCNVSEPCDAYTVQVTPPKLCPQSAPYCFTNIVQINDKKDIFKGCADHDFCMSKYWTTSANNQDCKAVDFTGMTVDCTFCCTGVGCNLPVRPFDINLVNFQ